MMTAKKKSETLTEGIFRDFYGASTFIEKSAISSEYGFKSKKNTDEDGYPDFFLETEKYVIVVEAKALNAQYAQACSEVKFYATHNQVEKDIFAIAIAGQTREDYKAGLFYIIDGKKVQEYETNGKLLTLDDIARIYKKLKYTDKISDEALKKKLKEYNEMFQAYKIQDTKRSLFFSGLMIALMDETFLGTYMGIKEPNERQQKTNKLIAAHNLNENILNAIVNQITDKINTHSKEYHWRDQFAFIRNIDIPLVEYKKIIKDIETNIFIPFREDEKHDILSRAYKIFLSRAGKMENKNIILTPDHIKELMVELARLDVNDKVLDTCTGSGAFLMEALEKLISLAKGDSAVIDRIMNEQLIGVEIDDTLFALACTNMFLHHDGRTKLIFGSSLNTEGNQDVVKYIEEQGATKCIINPPYENNQPIHFVRQAVRFLKPNGCLVVIMPTPTLNRNVGGLTDEILGEARLDFVIKMPERLFSEQGRSVNTSIFAFTKTRHLPNDKVIFYDMQDDGHVSVQHKGRIDKYGQWNQIRQAAIECIVNKDHRVGNYEMRPIFKDGVCNCYGFRDMSRKGVNLVRLGDLFETGEKGSLASENAEPGEYPFITASEEWKTHAAFDHDCEAIIYAVAASGSLGRCHYVSGKFIASNLCLILTPKNQDEYPVNMQFYSLYLNSLRQTIRNDIADGTSKLTIAEEDLKDYLVEYIPIAEQDRIAKKYEKTVLRLREKLKKEERKIESEILSL